KSRLHRSQAGSILAEGLLSQCEREERGSGSDGDVLLAINRVAHRTAVDLPSERYFPEQRPRLGIESEEVAFTATAKDHIAGGRKDSSPRDVVHLELPLLVESPGVKRTN